MAGARPYRVVSEKLSRNYVTAFQWTTASAGVTETPCVASENFPLRIDTEDKLSGLIESAVSGFVEDDHHAAETDSYRKQINNEADIGQVEQNGQDDQADQQ